MKYFQNTCPIYLEIFDICDAAQCVILAQTDTTAGFLSRDYMAINKKKGAPIKKPLLMEVSNLYLIPHRIPIAMKNFVRRAKKTSYILPNHKSFRVVSTGLHHDFLRGYKWLYSSSANPTKDVFSLEFAKNKCDIIVLDSRGIFASKSSSILKMRHNRVKKIR